MAINNEENREIFNNIAKTYDKLNHILSFNIDKFWRRKALKKHVNSTTEKVLDVACGTGDFAIQAAKMGAQEIIGIDISKEMLRIGREKIAKFYPEPYTSDMQLGNNRSKLKQTKKSMSKITLLEGDSAKLNFEDNTFDMVTVAFGVRNFENLQDSLKEIYRVLKDEGKLIVLELSTPRNKLIGRFYNLYIKKILPRVGKRISRNNEAYFYLPSSIEKFIQYEDFTNLLSCLGFKNTHYKTMTLGIACVYFGEVTDKN